MKDTIYRQQAIDALWKALYEYEDKTEKQFQESDELDVGDWILHSIFVQNMSDIDRQTILALPPAQPEIIRCKDCRHLLLTGGKARRMTLFEALQPDSPYVFYSDDHGFCINTADVMDILTMDKESVIYRQAAIDDIGKDVERREE